MRLSATLWAVSSLLANEFTATFSNPRPNQEKSIVRVQSGQHSTSTAFTVRFQTLILLSSLRRPFSLSPPRQSLPAHANYPACHQVLASHFGIWRCREGDSDQERFPEEAAPPKRSLAFRRRHQPPLQEPAAGRDTPETRRLKDRTTALTEQAECCALLNRRFNLGQDCFVRLPLHRSR